MIRVAYGIAYGDIGYAGYDHDVAGAGFSYSRAAEASVYEYLVDLVFGDAAV